MINNISNAFVSNFTKTNSCTKNSTLKKENKNLSIDAKSVMPQYNPAFAGFFNRGEDARVRLDMIQLTPYKKYLIDSNDTEILLPDVTLDCNSFKMQEIINSIKPNSSIILGRSNSSSIFLQDYPSVSRQHFKLEKDFQSRLYISDVGSLNGTILLPNVKKIDKNVGEFKLKPMQNYLVPIDTEIALSPDTIINLAQYQKEFDRAKDNTLIFGTKKNKNTNICFNDYFVSPAHLMAKKTNSGILIKDLNSFNGVYVLDPSKIEKNKTDLSNIQKIETLSKSPTIIPSDCQILLGGDLAIDMRNENITSLLEQKGKLMVGRSLNADIVIPEFYDKVSRKHLTIERKDGKIIVQDLGSTNDTQIVPKNQIRPFYKGVEDIELSQQNVGDCYLLATLYAMSRNSVGQECLENMVRVDNEGNYIVSFYKQQPIKVKPSELDGQKSPGKTDKISVYGDLGIKAIERAYAKLIKVNRFFYNSRGNATMFANIDDGGWPGVALEKMTGIHSKEYYLSPRSCKSILKSVADEGLENQIITCTSYNQGKYGPRKDYLDPEMKFCSKHAYAIKYIDAKNQRVGIANPHNTKKEYDISWDEFGEIFDSIITANTTQRC